MHTIITFDNVNAYNTVRTRMPRYLLIRFLRTAHGIKGAGTVMYCIHCSPQTKFETLMDLLKLVFFFIPKTINQKERDKHFATSTIKYLN